MTQLQFLVDYLGWLVGVAFWVSLAFPAVTALYWPWWKEAWGWNIVTLEACIAFTLLPSILHREFGVAIGLPLYWIEAVSFTGVPVIIIWRTVMIWVTQRAALRERRAARSPAVSGGAEDGGAVSAGEG